MCPEQPRHTGPAGPVPLGIYVHFPWCLRRCPYCDFNAHATSREQLPHAAWLAAILGQMGPIAALMPNTVTATATSLFIGGGTPSLLPPASIAQLLKACRDHFAFSQTSEITLEANPGSLESDHPAAYRQAGVNRLSIGVQSFDDTCLTAIGRIHSSQDAKRAAADAIAAGLRTNIDLMYGLPEQTLALALDDLRQAIDTGAEHISWYQLTLEPNTAFFKHPPALPDENLIEAIEQEGRALLSQSGFQRYEISAWAKSGQLCQHNLNYWQFGDYIGLGPGAHSKLSLGRHTAVVRFAQLRHPQAWLQHQAQNLLHAHPLGRPEGNQPLTESDLVLEFFLNAFRLSQPPCHLLEERTGIHPDHPKVQQALQQARELKLLQPDCFQPTERGTRHLDHLIALFS